ncbi:MAG: DUF2399 domain-containing protein [Chloroflexi bacterium]|nr:DUF2399 domain-containing protein [Chloroflexota bacterium]
MATELQPLLCEVVMLLETLLVQAEQPQRKQVVRVRLNKRDHPWYFAGNQLGLRYKVNDQLQLLSAEGWLRLHWQKYEEGNYLQAVDLLTQQPNTLDRLYELLGKVPLRTMKEKMRHLLLSQQPHGSWLHSFLSWALAQLAADKSPEPLSLADLQESEDVLRALSAIARLNTPTLERTLSVQIFGDSKRCETLRGKILTVLRAHTPEAAAYGEDDWALLQAHNVYRTPEYAPLTGPLSLALNKVNREGTIYVTHLQLEPDLPSVSLSEDILRSAEIVSCPATALITVENMTSFSELLLLRPSSTMLVFTGGFASPALLTLLSKIRTHRPALPFWHWGDLDAGGLRILAHLRRHLGNILPLGMNIETFERYRAHAQPLTANDRASLDALVADPMLSDCIAVIQHVLEMGLKLEQEAVRVGDVLGQVSL